MHGDPAGGRAMVGVADGIGEGARGRNAGLASRGLRRLLPAGLGPGGRRAALLLLGLAAVRAAALVLIAEGIAGGIGAIEAGGSVRAALVLGAIGAVLRAAGGWGTGVVAARGASAAKAAARARLVDRLLDPRGTGSGAGEAAELAANGLDALDDYFGSVLPAITGALVVPAALGVWILARDWPSALVLILTVPLVPLFMVLIGRYTEEQTAAAQQALARLADRMVELARGLPVLVGLGRDQEQGRALSAIQDESRRRTRLTLRTAFLSSLALELVAMISVAVIAVLFGIRLLDGSVALAPALAVLVLAPECFGALREVGTAFHAAQDGLAALQRLDELGAPQGATVTGEVMRTPEGIEVRGLTVRQPGRRRPALEGVDARFAAGELTALVGRSGCGKSTLLAELAAAFGPVAYAPQAPAFLADRVLDELLAYGAATEAAAAMLDRLGLAARAEDDPTQLSPGEARRLLVAAALLVASRGVGVVLLDEPTAHLDPASAAMVRAAIAALRGAATVVVATHDPALIAAADRIVALPARESSAQAGPSPAQVVPSSANAIPSSVPSLRGERPDPRGDGPDSPSDRVVPLGSVPAPRTRWWLAVLLGTLAAASGIALAATSGWLIVRASEGPAIMFLLVAIVGVRFFGIARAAARYAERLVTHDAVLATVDRLRSRLWMTLASRGAASRRLLSGGSTADLLVARLGQLREELPRVLVPGLVGILVLLGAVMTTAWIAPAAVWVITAFLLLGAAGGVLTGLPLAAAMERRGAFRARLARRIASLAEAGPVLTVNGCAPRTRAELARLGSQLAAIDLRIAVLGGLGAVLATLGVFGAALAAIAVGGTGGPEAAAVALLATAILDPLLALLAAARRLPALLAARAAVAPALRPVPAPPSGEMLLLHDDRLELDGVGVRWPDAAEPAVRDATAVVRPGEWLHISGPSGSGKSTLLSVLLGRLGAERGRIALGGVALVDADREEWRAAVGWCPQEAHVFDSTIRGNLLLARPRDLAPSEAEMLGALREAGLGPLLAELADGLDTRVGPGGRALSGGERQRLAVARVLLGGARVLLLDEPTAHLDEEGAAALIADLRVATRDRTVVLVSHRETDARPGDPVLRLGAATAQSAAESPSLAAVC